MSLTLFLSWAFLLISSLQCPAESQGLLKNFNVMDYGAIADGVTDNMTWFFVHNLSGPCKGQIEFLNSGIISAPTDPSKFLTDKWINFSQLDNLTVTGGGIFNGQGKVAWPHNDCSKNPHCPPLPASRRFDFVNYARVRDVSSINSKSAHLIIFGCHDKNISNIKLSAPGVSPNTDGIKISHSQRIVIENSTIATGDDCVAMLPGARDVKLTNVVCGPGHGISIGSLGKSGDEDVLSGVMVKNCTFRGTSNGVRIKTWALPVLKDTEASNFLYEDILMDNVRFPIMIDQEYCPSRSCQNVPSRVQISNVTFRNIWGNSGSEEAVMIKCSQARPCKNVVMENISLFYNGSTGHATASCSNVNGRAIGKQDPPHCL